MFVDTHAHLNFNAFKNDLDKVISRSLEKNVWMINIGTNYQTSKRAVEIAERYEKGVYAAIGLHPINIQQNSKLKSQKSEPQPKTQNLEDVLEDNFDFNKYKNLTLDRNLDSFGIKELTKSKKVVAIGEIGLDYYRKPKSKKKLEIFKEWQRTVLCQQLELARELNLPVIFHCRMGHQDLLKILKSQITNHKSQTNPKSQIPNSKIRGVVHCFTGSWQQAQKFLEMGLYLGFNGIIFKSIERISFEENVKKTPLERILIETDCPYLSPPEKENERNEPLFVKYIAERIAKIKNISFNEMAEITTQNAKNLFKI